MPCVYAGPMRIYRYRGNPAKLYVHCRSAVINGAFLSLVVYSLFYIGLEQFAGITWCLFTGVPCWLTATAFAQHVSYAWAWAIGVHALSWYFQIHVGHIMLEHQKPALLDSFFQVRIICYQL